jgi:ATP adenylyltransferase
VERLWAPWRIEYILRGDEAPGECILCAFPAHGRTRFREHLILAATEHGFVMLNRYPYANGHVMVVPTAHAARPGDLAPEAWGATGELLRGAIAALGAAVKADGMNVGMNLGRVAGAGIDGHLHWHVVPRWAGDQNFMPVIADVKVMSDALEACYERLLPHFAPLGEGPA